MALKTLNDLMQVIMLPTDKEGAIVLENDDVKKLHVVTPKRKKEAGWNYQHLYFLSDGLLEINDWVYDVEANGIFQFKNPKGLYFCGELKKVEATTDSSLGYWKETMNKDNGGDTDTFYPLPQIPQSFVEKHAQYSGSINKVRLAIEQVANGCVIDNKEDYDFYMKQYATFVERIKLNSDNTVIVKEYH